MGKSGLTTRSIARPVLWHALLASSMLTGIGPILGDGHGGAGGGMLDGVVNYIY